MDQNDAHADTHTQEDVIHLIGPAVSVAADRYLHTYIIAITH